ncbi:unnamed protein product [Closterium sp. NIES-53]
MPAPAPPTEVIESLIERREPETRASTPVCARRVACPRPPAVPGTHGMALLPSFVPQRVVLPEPPASSLPHVPDPESDLARTASPTITRLLATIVTDPDLESTAAFALVTELVGFAPRSRLDYVASLVTGSESVCPPSVGGELTLGSDVLGFLEGSLHKNIWLRRPPGFTGSFPAGTQWSLRRPVYGLRQAPREWHDTLRTTLSALWLAPVPADQSLFLRTDTTLPPFYVLVFVDDLVFATADTEALALVKAKLQERQTCTDMGELRSYLGLQITRDRARRTITLTQSHMVHHVLQRFAFQFSSPQPTPLSNGHSLSAPPLDESVEPSGPYPELEGCLMYLMTCTRPDLAYPLSLLARYVAPVHRAWGSCLEDMVKCCEAEIYAGVMAAQELRWLTYLMTDLGERPRSPPVLYVDNKAMLALCHEQRLEHRTKHVALHYFLARELQQRRQLRLSYVASQANTADVFTKALGSGDH